MLLKNLNTEGKGLIFISNSLTSIKILSDYTPADEPNFLQIIKDGQGDFHLNIVRLNDNERGVRIANSGSRHSPKVREALKHLIDVYEEELKTTHNEALIKLNGGD